MKTNESFEDSLKYGYHRTSQNATEGIIKNGFSPGYGDMYGKGYYMCVNIEDQLKPTMLQYGKSIIKAELYPHGLLIFDYVLAKKVYGDNSYTIADQLVEIGAFKSKAEVSVYWKRMSEACDVTLQDPKMSAHIAYQAFVCGADPKWVCLSEQNKATHRAQFGDADSQFDSNGVPKLKFITGIVYSGYNDATALVVYRPALAKPVAYVHDIGYHSDAVVNDDPTLIEWIPVDETNKQGIESRAKKEAQLYEIITKVANANIDSVEIECDISIDDIKEKLSWLTKMCQFRNAQIRIDKEGRFCFDAGTWKQGVFKGYSFGAKAVGTEYATFDGGIFEGEVFGRFGQWRFGVFRGKKFEGRAAAAKGNMVGQWRAEGSAWNKSTAVLNSDCSWNFENPVGSGKLTLGKPGVTPRIFYNASDDTDGQNEEYEIGDIGPAGGWIFYDKGDDSDGWRYLEAAPTDITKGTTREFVFGYYRTSPNGDNLYVNGSTTYVEGTSDSNDGKSTGTAIGTGKANTTKLVSKMESSAYASSSGSDTTANYAAKLCDDYTYGGYSDWFLPSKDELNLMYENLKTNGLGRFDSSDYWSSSEYYNNALNAWYQFFSYGFQSNYFYRNNFYRVRAVRAF